MGNVGHLATFSISYASGSTTNKTNGGQTKLNVNFKMSALQIYEGDVLYFTLPSEFEINPIGNNFNCINAVCTRSGKSIAAKIPGTSLKPKGESYEF